MSARLRRLEELPREAPPTRARIAERLLAGLDTKTDPENGELWLAEAERCLHELESGRAKGVPADQVIADVRSKLR